MPSETGSFCGTISPGNDVDYVKFILPGAATAFSMRDVSTNGANIQVDATDNGVAFDFGGTYPFDPGHTYELKISGKDHTTAFDYRIEVSITKP
jgi:hypothetical protein